MDAAQTERVTGTMGNILVIDTSYGSTVGIDEPIVETDSRTHVERLQANVAKVVADAGLEPSDLDTIIVGTGPGPFTGLRAGIVTAKALAFATGARLIGHDILSPQARWNRMRRKENGSLGDLCSSTRRIVTLAVNDARRKQLYFQLEETSVDEEGHHDVLIDMDIDYPVSIVQRVNEAMDRYARDHEGAELIVDVIGHGAAKYADAFAGLRHLGDICDESVLDQGERGLSLFVIDALMAYDAQPDAPVEPLYLRRPDAEVPNPLKHVLGHSGATKA